MIDISGPAYVIDADTLRIGQERIRLFGIDAPELEQLCSDQPCGRLARDRAVVIVGSRQVTCAGNSRDRYRRLIATCRINGRDLGRQLVAEGWAMAYVRYSRRYLGEETRARGARRGIWQWEVVTPEVWRRH